MMLMDPLQYVYQLRHTFACWNLTAHGNREFIAQQISHADESILIRYTVAGWETQFVQKIYKFWERSKQ